MIVPVFYTESCNGLAMKLFHLKSNVVSKQITMIQGNKLTISSKRPDNKFG